MVKGGGVEPSMAFERHRVHASLPVLAGRRIWTHDSQASKFRLSVLAGVCPNPAIVDPRLEGASGPTSREGKYGEGWHNAIAIVSVALHCFIWGGAASVASYRESVVLRTNALRADQQRFVFDSMQAIEMLADPALLGLLEASGIGETSEDSSDADVTVLSAARALQGLSSHLSGHQSSTGSSRDSATARSGETPYISAPGAGQSQAGTMRSILAGAVAFISVETGGSMLIPMSSVSACWAADVSTGRKPRPGATGLVNLGNSCYMSAAI